MTDSTLQRIIALAFLFVVMSLRAHPQTSCASPAYPKPSAAVVQQMESEVGTEILRYRSDAKLPPLKLFRERSKMRELSKFVPSNYIQIGIDNAGFNPMTGVRSAFLFDSSCPLTATAQLKEIAKWERPHGKNGKLLIDDAQRLAVRIAVIDNPPRYRVVVAYWYSKFGTLLDTLPRGKE